MSVVTGYLQKRATEKTANQAAQAQREGTAMGIEEQRRQFDISREDLAPWMKAGGNALLKQQQLMGLVPSDMTIEEMVMQDPSYLWRVSQGKKALEGSAAAQGGLFSGRTGKALTDYGQNQGLSEYQNIINRLAGVSGTGQSTAQTVGGWGNQMGANIAQGYQNMGNASANAILTGGQATAGFYNQLGDAARRAATAYFTGGM